MNQDDSAYLELDPNHELQLPRESGTSVRRTGIVVVVVEIVGGGDLTQRPYRR
jgi:hypothetical protein